MEISEFLKRSYTKDYFFDIVHYDIEYVIDASNHIFTSDQKITFKCKGCKDVKKIEGGIQGHLTVDSVDLLLKGSKQKILSHWEIQQFEGPYVQREGLEGICSKLVVLHLNESIKPEKEMILQISLHMPREEIMKSKPLYMWSFCMNEKVCYAVDPYAGQYFMLIPATFSAPFDITIKYPKGQSACLPGLLLSRTCDGDYFIEHYRSETEDIPAFAVSDYKRISREEDAVGIEFYLYPHQSVNGKTIDHILEIIQLYVTTFGDNGIRLYRFATIGETPSRLPGGENKGNTIFYPEEFFSRDLSEQSAFLNFVSTNSHEIYHNWNLFHSSVNGILSEWFAEGGANFIAAWAIEKTIGVDEGVIAREAYLMDYLKNEGYKATEPLAMASKLSGDKSRALMYDFGALVWEQLRQKIGETALIDGLAHFYEKYPFQSRRIDDFFACLQDNTEVDVREYMDQWANHNTRIELSIENVNYKEINAIGKCEVTVQMKADRDYEVFTELVYKFANETRWSIIPLHFTKQGERTKISFDCKLEPVMIQLDPFCRVPHINKENCVWHLPCSG
jgi:hypothetical protein